MKCRTPRYAINQIRHNANYWGISSAIDNIGALLANIKFISVFDL